MKKEEKILSFNILWFLSILVLIIFIPINLFTILKIPPIWPDEALHADLVLSILNHGVTGTNLLSGTLPGVETFGFGYPPFYFYTSALWFKIFGFSIYKFRLLSLFLGSIFLVLFFVLVPVFKGKSIGKKDKLAKILGILSVIALILDSAFIKVIHIARPEIEVLVLGFLSLLFFLKWQEGKGNKAIFSILSGLLLGVAFITHYLACIFLFSLIFYLFILRLKGFKGLKEFYLFIAAFLFVVFVWVISVFPNIHYLVNDITLRARYKTAAPYWIWVVFASSPFLEKIVYILYLIIGWETVMFTLSNKLIKGYLVLLLNLFSWTLTYIWQTEYSFIYTVIFTYFSLIYLILSSLTLENLLNFKVKAYISILFILITLNLYQSINSLNRFKNDHYSYEAYSKSLVASIPKGVNVYSSAIPDPYFALIGRNTIFEFPVLPTTKTEMEKVLNKSDYIIFNSSLESIVSGNVVVPYINKNAEGFYEVSGQNQYGVTIIKLKPRNERVASELNNNR